MSDNRRSPSPVETVRALQSGMSQAELARLSGVSRQRIFQIKERATTARILRFVHADGNMAELHKPSLEEAMASWARLVLEWQAHGYTYLQTSDTTGCAFMAGDTINVELVEVS